ncbi:hypothetical protein [Streptomyces sp. NPDC045251]|uniref:hypothetical protein n=1 Tax=unclassified Streptomyces TaxID=2593676 RepID=UPI0033DC7029
MTAVPVRGMVTDLHGADDMRHRLARLAGLPLLPLLDLVLPGSGRRRRRRRHAATTAPTESRQQARRRALQFALRGIGLGPRGLHGVEVAR